MIYVALPYLFVTAIFVLFQRSLIFRPSRSAPLPAASAELDPHSAEDVEVSADDGVVLHGWLIRSFRNHERAEDHRWLMIDFPGNSGHRYERRSDLREIADLGLDVLIVDYRGYAENQGAPTEERLAADARAVWQAAIDRYRYAPSQIVVFGESLGGAVATRLAAELGDDAPAALILASTFNSLADVASWTYPAFPFGILLWDHFDSETRIAGVRCSVIVIHGADDEFVPVELGQRLFDAAPELSAKGVTKRWEKVAGMGHNDVPLHVLRKSLEDVMASPAIDVDSLPRTGSKRVSLENLCRFCR
ncbi:alpha/beta hydrolase [Caulifigura coniformis]|uniref:alpha/beta hydrolase n=1 Tax=Caulifigura coniformis TaxID=2527983 RepID=UPI0011A36629|nr:alpha/beta hydrolase [Caulifigura coniformis]